MRSFASQECRRRGILTATRELIAVLAVLFLIGSGAAYGQQAAQAPIQPGLKPILSYISTNWDKLTRSMTSCESIVDPKMQVAPVLYLPADFPNPAAVTKLQADCTVDVEHLAKPITALGQIDMSTIHQHGLLYLPNQYVVPGGRFNEMYGWDSYFTIRGLLEDGRLDLAQGMVENFFFEIEPDGPKPQAVAPFEFFDLELGDF